MGLGESEASIDKASAIACSICLEIVASGGDRSTARLQCGHEFHLDCIGSAFNVKGVMQCPNCRKVEKGNWLYANGSRSQPYLGFDEWNHDEDLYELSYSEMTFGVHWCPFSRLARAPSSFDSGSRRAGSFVSSLIPPYLTNSQPHGHVRDRYQHHNSPGLRGTIFSGAQQRSGSTNRLPPTPVGPTPPSLPDQTTYYLFPPTASSSRTHHNVENPGDRFYSTWEREHLVPFPLLPVPIDRESGWWSPFVHSNSSSDSSSRTSYWHRTGSERPSSQGRTEASSYRPPHVGRMRPYV